MIKNCLAILALLFSLTVAAADYPKVLNITYVKAPFNIQNMVMKEQGLLEKEFQAEGIQIHWIPIKAGLNQVRGMAAGEIDMVSAMNTSTLLIANSVGNRIVIVDGVAHPDNTFALVAKPAVAKSVAELKGKRVVGPKGTVLHHMLLASLVQNDLSMKDVDFVSMNLPASLTTLLSGRADAALVAAGGLLKAQSEGFEPIVKAKGLIGTNLVLAARADFAQRYPELVRRVAKVNREALAWAQNHRDEAVALGAKAHGISISEAQQLFDWSGFYADVTEEDVKALEESQAFLLSEKMMTQPVDVHSLFWPKAP